MQVDSAQWQSVAKKEPEQNARPGLIARPAHDRNLLWQAAQRGDWLLLSEAARPVRFICTGGVAALFQLGVLGVLSHYGWTAYHVSITGTLLLNQLLFLTAHLVLPLLLASMLGMSVAAIANFVLMNRLVFRQHNVCPRTPKR